MLLPPATLTVSPKSCVCVGGFWASMKGKQLIPAQARDVPAVERTGAHKKDNNGVLLRGGRAHCWFRHLLLRLSTRKPWCGDASNQRAHLLSRAFTTGFPG